MKLIYKTLPSKRRECVASIGVFDGIHLGHRFIINKVIELAKKWGIASLLITFDIPPEEFFGKNNPAINFPGYLTDFEEKKNVLKSLNINYIWFLKTDHNLLRLKGEDFLAFILNHFDIKSFVVGDDFRFGYKGETDIRYLKKLVEQNDIALTILKRKRKNGEILSSTLIRKCIREAKLRRVKTFLGRNYSLSGIVVKGRGYGKKISFPTANIETGNFVLPQEGVYAAIASIGKKNYLAAVNVGRRPTISDSCEIIVEAHIIDFYRYIVGENIKIIFLEKIRKEKKFSSIDKLKEAIAQDIIFIKTKYFSQIVHSTNL